MTSKAKHDEIFAWIWLPEETQPIVAGKLTQIDERVLFTYGQSYLNHPRAISIYDKELPLRAGDHEKRFGTETLPGCIRDASPDAWGRRVILNKILGAKGKSADTGELDEFTYLTESGSDRVGGLDFQKSSEVYEPRLSERASLADLLDSAALIEEGIPLVTELAQAFYHGTSIGGARPKAMIEGGKEKFVAKFSSGTDQYNVIKAEFIAMRLARLCGLNVADVTLTNTSGKDVLLVKRFDRALAEHGWARKLILSALTLLGLDEMTSRYASYENLAELIRQRFTDPKATLREMYGRVVFNVLCGNTDDHARNHAAFWDGKLPTLTPAYDICPQLRQGGEASQAMLIAGDDRSSRLTTCLKAVRCFLLGDDEARHIVDAQVTTIKENWDRVCDEAALTPVDRELFKAHLFLNAYAFEGYES